MPVQPDLRPMFEPFKKLKLAGAFLGVESPAATPENLDIAELFGRLSTKDLRGMTLQADKLLEQPGVRALHESRYMPAHEPLDKLSDLGEGTLGFEYARYLRLNKLPQPAHGRNVDLSDANVYLSQRVRITHPILHVVTEYDSSPLGELALQAYYVGQLDNLISGVIISSVILQISRDSPELLGPALEVTAEAYQRGKAARSFLGIAWEELWSAQVPQLRELIDIPSRTSSVASLRPEPAAPVEPTRRSNSNSGPYEDGFAAFSRSSSSSSSSSSYPSASSSSSSMSNRGFAGFGSSSSSSSSSSTPSKPTPAPTPSKPSRPPEPPSKLLASFMALSEQEAAHPAPPPTPEPPPPARAAPPPRVAEPPRQPIKPPPPPPAKTPAPEPGYQVEETAKNITPALSPDDPDYF